ncbi:UNVERIFIED_CONTAM: hypothetical protein GTU68_010418 [Idotea baltica]|nr:hypothetical protein [Idotea baltica]
MRIFDNCTIHANFENQHVNVLLLGDGGYAWFPFLMTPFPQPHTPTQRRYNRAHIIRTRSIIERTFGIWKRRFPALPYGLRVKVDKL